MIRQLKTKKIELPTQFPFSEVKTKEKDAQAIKNVSPQIACFRVKRQANNRNPSQNPNQVGMAQDQLVVGLIKQCLSLHQSPILHR